MSTTISYKLPNLTALLRPFELRTNQNCRTVSLASEKWLLESVSDIPDAAESDVLRDVQTGLLVRPGLLAALCYPTCDAPQLRLITDFLGLLACSNGRVILTRRDAHLQWVSEGSGDRNNSSKGTGLAIEDNVLFRRLATRLSRLAGHAHPSWAARFDRSTDAFRAAQLQITKNHQEGVLPDLESCIALRRDLSGLRMMFDLIEIAEGLVLPREVVEGSVVGKLRQCAMEIVAWSMDILSYKLDYSRGNKDNLISVLMSEKGLSLQGAINFAGNLVKQSIEAFIVTERSLTSSWDDRTVDDVCMYIQGLRDCISGSIHWGYDGEMFFGGKGNDVRAFGWVFLSQVTEPAVSSVPGG